MQETNNSVSSPPATLSGSSYTGPFVVAPVLSGKTTFLSQNPTWTDADELVKLSGANDRLRELRADAIRRADWRRHNEAHLSALGKGMARWKTERGRAPRGVLVHHELALTAFGAITQQLRAIVLIERAEFERRLASLGHDAVSTQRALLARSNREQTLDLIAKHNRVRVFNSVAAAAEYAMSTYSSTPQVTR